MILYFISHRLLGYFASALHSPRVTDGILSDDRRYDRLDLVSGSILDSVNVTSDACHVDAASANEGSSCSSGRGDDNNGVAPSDGR